MMIDIDKIADRFQSLSFPNDKKIYVSCWNIFAYLIVEYMLSLQSPKRQ